MGPQDKARTMPRRVKSALSLSLMAGPSSLLRSASSQGLTATDSYGNLSDMDCAVGTSNSVDSASVQQQTALPEQDAVLEEHHGAFAGDAGQEEEDKATPALEIPYTRCAHTIGPGRDPGAGSQGGKSEGAILPRTQSRGGSAFFVVSSTAPARTPGAPAWPREARTWRIMPSAAQLAAHVGLGRRRPAARAREARKGRGAPLGARARPRRRARISRVATEKTRWCTSSSKPRVGRLWGLAPFKTRPCAKVCVAAIMPSGAQNGPLAPCSCFNAPTPTHTTRAARARLDRAERQGRAFDQQLELLAAVRAYFAAQQQQQHHALQPAA